MKRIEPETRICAYCGNEFTAEFDNSKYCSKKCCYTATKKLARQREKEKKPLERECLICGTPFKVNMHNKKYCSAECRAKGEQAIKIARHKKVYGETLHVDAELPKPKYKCRVCGQLTYNRFYCPECLHNKMYTLEYYGGVDDE